MRDTINGRAQPEGLELEWNLVFEAYIAARAEYEALAATSTATLQTLDTAREQFERAAARKERFIVRIESLSVNAYATN